MRALVMLLVLGGCNALVSFDPPAELGVQCMDGLDNDEDGFLDCEEEACVAECQQTRCGDAMVTGAEECDDGNDMPGDGCEPETCLFSCGSGLASDLRAYDPETGHCFLGFLPPLDAQSASTACLALGGYLAVPDAGTEDALIRSAAPNDATLGLADNLPSSAYEFYQVTGDLRAEYLNFSAGQPDEPLDQTMICVSYDGGASTWQDHNCATARPYVCEVEQQHCGDLVIQPNEGCDDGNSAALDGCSDTCADEDECALGIDNCSPDANCFNQAWSRLYPGFTCECLPGFTGDGVTCLPS